MTYKIIYQDQSILAIDKPQGLPTATGNNINLCALIFYDFPALKDVNGYKPGEGGLLNRLDNETGGLVLFAKSDESFEYYSDQMKNEKIIKNYIAIVDGIPDKKEGVISIPIGHHYKNKKKMTIISERGKFRGNPQKAETAWKLLKKFDNSSIIEAVIKKGIRHQIRVHLNYLGLPIKGDKLYNKNENDFYPNHLLYCYSLSFVNFDHKKIKIKTEVPFLNDF
jgi:23S rRNA pseudouridine1911/1915/1917 synthase